MPTEGLLASAKSARGGVNMFVIIVAFILSIMVIDTRNKCNNVKSYDQYKSDTQLSFTIALVIIIGTCLLFAYDLGVMFDFIK
jgi:hypothetical protein